MDTSSSSAAAGAVAESTTTTFASLSARVGTTTATADPVAFGGDADAGTTPLPDGPSAAASSFDDSEHPPPTSTTTTSAAPIAVDPARKRRLLLEARKDRIAWIDASSVPYRIDADADPSDGSGSSKAGGMAGEAEEEGDVLSMLKSSRACAEVESAMDVLSSLYGGFDRGGSSTGGGKAKGRDRSDDAAATGDVEERIRRQLRDQITSASPDDVSRAVLSAADRRSVFLAREEAAARPGVGHHLVDPLLLEPYSNLLSDLRSVESALFVQGMRNFVRSFEELASSLKESATKRTEEEDTEMAQEEDLRKLLSAMATYLDGTRDAMRTKDAAVGTAGHDGGNDDGTARAGNDDGAGGGGDPFQDYARRALEAFVYSKVYASIWSVLLTPKSKADDADVAERSSSLQFVMPRHLEIQCLANVIPEEEGKGEDADSAAERTIDRILREPIESLKAMDLQHSSGEKLRCVLEAYRGVNASLTSAMNGDKEDDGDDGSGEPSSAASSSSGKVKGGKGGAALPGADDVLPALILAVIRSRPVRIASNLKFVDAFATPDQLRGEAGYAYTNLYGAVQFVRDLDLGGGADGAAGGAAVVEGETEEAGGTTPSSSSLKIDPEEFRRGLERCRERARKELEAKEREGRRGASRSDNDGRPTTMEDGTGGGSTSIAGGRSRGVATKEEERRLPPDVEAPTPREIRAARLRGEDVDLDWALRWQEERRVTTEEAELTSSAAGEVTGQQGSSDVPPDAVQRSVYDTVDPPLPPRFSRSYAFLSTNPDDVRLSDLPRLLSEYRALVRATENLLAERSAVQLRERRRMEKERRDKLANDALAADEALLLG